MPTIRRRGDAFQAIVRLTINGQTYNESRSFQIETSTPAGVNAAQWLARDWADRLEEKIRGNGVPQRKLNTRTLGSLIETYELTLSAIRPIGRTMQHEYAHLAAEFKNVKLAELSSEVFTKYATNRKEKYDTGPATILHNLATVRSVLNAARPMYGIHIDGATVTEALAALKRVGLVAKSQSRTRRPTENELLRIRQEFERIASHPSTKIPMATIVDLAIALPRRLGELTDARWLDYTPDARTIKLLDTKHPSIVRDEIVPVPPEAARIIAALPVFDERMLPYNSASVSAAFQRCCNRLGIDDLTFHDLRHHGISRLFEKGLGVHEVARISGHMSWTALKRYTHITTDTVLEKLT